MDLSRLKKDIGLFLRSEEAKVLKKDVAKWGISASIIAMIMSQQITQAQAAEHYDTHSDSHTDTHSDSTHSDSHSDTHSDSHTDGCHADNVIAHSDHSDGLHGSIISEHADHDDSTCTAHTDIGHSDGSWPQHTSVTAAYDNFNRAGGHSSSMTVTHLNTHLSG